MADKVKELNQYNLLKSKYIGIGSADTNREEFITTIHRDTYASLAAHDNILTYNSVALNEDVEFLRQRLIKKMVKPLSGK